MVKALLPAIFLAALPVHAQTTTPTFQLDTTGTCRRLQVYDSGGPSWDTMGCLDQTTHLYLPDLSGVTGTAGTKVPYLSGVNTWSGRQVFASGLNIGTNTAAQSALIVGPSGSQRPIIFQSASSGRWNLQTYNDAETGSNAGSSFFLFSYKDDGTSVAGPLIYASRASGPTGNGGPFFAQLAPANFVLSRAATPGGISGNYMSMDNAQPTTALGTDPISTTNGSPVVVVAWSGNGLNSSAYVKVSGATAVGGVTLSGWYPVVSATASNVSLQTGTSATSTATGGGASVNAQPSFTTTQNRQIFSVRSSAPGFSEASTVSLVVNPDYYVTTASGNPTPFYQALYSECYSPSDASGANTWQMTCNESDTINRGKDEGYQPIAYSAVRSTIGRWEVAENLADPVTHAGNQGTNATAANYCSRGQFPNTTTNFLPKWYQCWVIAPDSLTSNSASPGGHGGVGLDLFGAYDPLPFNPIHTVAGSSTVSVDTYSIFGSLVSAHGSPTSVYWPSTTSLFGVTCAAGAHPLTSIAANSLQMSCSGSASTTGQGGGGGLWAAYDKDVPWAPMQLWGEYSRGINTTQAVFDDGHVLTVSDGQQVAFHKDGSSDIVWTSGTGSPEGVVTAPVGSLYTRRDGGAGTTFYVKESGGGNTGWVAK